MRCPYCNNGTSYVMDSRTIEKGTVVRRRRICPECRKQFITKEKYKEKRNDNNLSM